MAQILAASGAHGQKPGVRPHSGSGVGTLFYPFGQEFTRLRKFRENFQTALSAAYGQYRWANFEVDEAGMGLFASRPPIVLREVRGV